MKGNFHVQFGIGGGEVALSADHTRNNDEEIAQNALSTPHEAWVKEKTAGTFFRRRVGQQAFSRSLSQGL